VDTDHAKVVISQCQKLSNLHKIGKNWNFHIVSIDTRQRGRINGVSKKTSCHYIFHYIFIKYNFVSKV